MKSALVAVIVCCMGFGTLQAQKAAGSKAPLVAKSTVVNKQSETPQEKAKDIVSKMTVACNLKPEQATKLTGTYVDYYTRHDALKKQKDILDKGTYDDRSTVMKRNRDSVIKAILTATQFKQWSAAKDKAKKEAKKEKSEE